MVKFCTLKSLRGSKEKESVCKVDFWFDGSRRSCDKPQKSAMPLLTRALHEDCGTY